MVNYYTLFFEKIEIKVPFLFVSFRNLGIPILLVENLNKCRIEREKGNMYRICFLLFLYMLMAYKLIVNVFFNFTN